MKRPRDFDAHRYLRETRHRPPQRRSTDRDYRLPLSLLGVSAYGVFCWWLMERLFPL